VQALVERRWELECWWLRRLKSTTKWRTTRVILMAPNTYASMRPVMSIRTTHHGAHTPDMYAVTNTRNPGRERPRAARGAASRGRGGVVHVLGSVSALIGTLTEAAQNAASSVASDFCATSCTHKALAWRTSVEAGRDDESIAVDDRVKEPG
jgi:hypothetical protein